MEIPTVIASFCWSLPICKKSDLLFWITLNTSDHFHLKWLKVLLLLLPYHMQKTNFITQLILEIKLTHYLLSLWACSGIPEHTHLKQWTNTWCFLGPLIISKNSTSYLEFFVRYYGLKNPAIWGFWILIQVPEIFVNMLFWQKLQKNIGTSCWSKKSYLNG